MNILIDMEKYINVRLIARTENIRHHHFIAPCFFAALLSPVLDGFERLLSHDTVHQLSSAAVIESQHFFCEKMSGDEN